jgi:hypothetical protein
MFLELSVSSTPSSERLWVTWKRRSITRSATSYMHTYLEEPPASRKAPSAE